jgi:uncharacterized damage-inducible protein DinB
MRLQDLVTLYEYNDWANRRILASAAQVSQAQFSTPSTHSLGSLHSILLHALDTEYGWRMRCQHNQSTPDLSEADFPSTEALEQRWQEEQAAMRAYLASLQDDDLTGLVRYTTSSGEQRERVLWHCLLHVVNHGTQHRSEAAALLTEYGHSPGDLDFTVFLNETDKS